MNCINGWNYIHGWNILVKQNSPHACNHTYGGIYTNEWIWNSWIKIDNNDGEISHMNEIIWMKVTFPLTFINIHLTCVSHSSSLPNNMCNWPYGWKIDNKIWTHGWQWQSSTLLNFIYMVNNIRIVNLFHGHNFIHVVASLLMRFTLSYFYYGLCLIYVIIFLPWPLSHLCYQFHPYDEVQSYILIVSLWFNFHPSGQFLSCYQSPCGQTSFMHPL
jgi:hypothetical protein